MYLGQIAQAVNGSLDRSVNGERVFGVSTDSRTLKRGEIFVALHGPNFDGHGFLPEVFRRGALAAVVDRPVAASAGPLIRVSDTRQAFGDLASAWRMTLPARVIGVTGTNGKTTTQAMISRLLEERGSLVKPPGNFNNLVGLPGTILSAPPRTDYLVLELGTNHHGEIRRLAQIARPDLAVITSVSEGHLEGLGDLEGVIAEKISIFDHLRGGGLGLVHHDSRILARMRLPRSRYRTFGRLAGADLRATDVEQDPLRFRIQGVSFELQLLGEWNVDNALAACAVGLECGLSLGECAERLRDFPPPKMRMEPLRLGRFMILNDAYNSNPASARNAVSEFGRMKVGRRFAIVGDMKELGAGSSRLHRALGRHIASFPIDQVAAVGPECRVLAGEIPGALHFERVEELCARLPCLVRPGDWILLKGSRAVALEKVVRCIGEMVFENG
jgi:UDP-N-acetylmuramoyl-tripeptide--D-alanyl-D-alanine ligase